MSQPPFSDLFEKMADPDNRSVWCLFLTLLILISYLVQMGKAGIPLALFAGLIGWAPWVFVLNKDKTDPRWLMSTRMSLWILSALLVGSIVMAIMGRLGPTV